MTAPHKFSPVFLDVAPGNYCAICGSSEAACAARQEPEGVPMTLPDLSALEVTARAATPGPWQAEQDGNHHHTIGPAGHGYAVSGYIEPADAAYIAAASPDVVLAMCAYIRELEDGVRAVLADNERLAKGG